MGTGQFSTCLSLAVALERLEIGQLSPFLSATPRRRKFRQDNHSRGLWGRLQPQPDKNRTHFLSASERFLIVRQGTGFKSNSIRIKSHVCTDHVLCRKSFSIEKPKLAHL